MIPTGTQRPSAAAASHPSTRPAPNRRAKGRSGSSVTARAASGSVRRRLLASITLVTSIPWLPEDPLGSEEEHQDHDQERYPRSVGGVDERGGYLPDYADHKRARQGAVRVADGPEDHRREKRQQQPPAHLRPQLSVEAVHDPARARQRAPDQPGPENHPVRVDARDPRQVRVVGGRAHRLADL